MKRLAVLVFLAAPLFAATTRNDDSCDVGLYPAATLLLPWFEVDVFTDRPDGETTIFTVTNTSAFPQAARVTLWTDFAFPVLSFNLYLTGYDVQKINLADVIRLGLIAPEGAIGSNRSPTGRLSEDDNQRLNEESCVNLPGALPPAFRTRIQQAFTTGKVPAAGSAPACNTAGGVHEKAAGYATIDLVGACTASLPTDTHYFSHEIRFDNVLIGDYIQVNGAQKYAQASPMVHIRAIPEGGEAATRKKTNLPRTFYSRLQRDATKTLDARQPLPSTFAARWIEGGRTGFQTFYKIWRESAATSSSVCTSYPAIGQMPYEIVRFDEEENPESIGPDFGIPPMFFRRVLPPASVTEISNDVIYPPNTQNAVGGWLYFNLQGAPNTSVATQNWVIASMRAESRFSTDIEALALGNGCSPPAPPSNASGGSHRIGPAPNVTP